MSSPSTVRPIGSAKTYGRRRRENPSSRAFDDMMTGKPAPIKASPSYTKWGKTNFVAIRGDKKSKLDARHDPGEEVMPEAGSEDPFSFETEDGRKSSPSKSSSRVVVTPDSQRSATRLPASRIVTQGRRGQGGAAASAPGGHPSSSHDNAAPSYTAAIARPGRTYTRSQEGRMGSSTGAASSQLIMDQFVEVGKTVKTNSGIEVVYSIEPHEPKVTSQVPSNAASSLPSERSPKKARLDLSPTHDDTPRGRRHSSIFDDDEDDNNDDSGENDDDDDIFPATFRRTPLKTYAGEIITPVSEEEDERPMKKKYKKRGRKPSRYSDPTLIEEYRRRYEKTHGKKEPTAGMFNSTVVSSKELRGTQGTTLVVVCKPKVEVNEKKDDVQTKYFKNVKKELDKADKNLGAAESQSQDEGEDDSESNPTTAPSSSPPEPKASPVVSPTPSSSSLKKSPAPSSADSGSTVSTPTRMLRVRFADQQTSSPASSSASSRSPEKRSQRIAAATAPRGRDSSASSSSKESVISISSEKSAASSGSAAAPKGKGEVGMTTRTRSGGGGGKQYRIFKSRGPPQPAVQDVAKDDQADRDSPPMPELTPEFPASSKGEEDVSKGQNPPNITEEEEEESEATPPASSSSSSAVTDSQGSQLSVDLSVSSKTLPDEPMEESPPASGSQKPSDSQDTPSPASDDSQELSQELPSSAESSQKEDAPAAPRRFFKSKKPSSASSLQRKVFEKSPSKASYNARSWHRDEEPGDKSEEGGPPPAKQAKKTLPFSDDTEKVSKASKEPKLTRAVHWSKDPSEDSYTSVRVQKQHKELYTVVHNVKMAHEVQESGETQDFMDDVEYLLDNLKDSQPYSIRALSTLQLAGKCILPPFRMHLRAHGTVTKIFSLLHDACSDSSLALSTASMMFMLSRDRLNMDLDKDSLHLMLKLNEVDMPRANGDHDTTVATESGVEGEEDSSELQKCRKRVQELLVQLQRETNAKQIDLDFVSTGNLAMESLLSLTSRRAGEWFKEELRVLGGLDHFVESINHCGSVMKGDLASNLDKYTPSLKKLDRCLRVLENITFMNSDNQTYIISYNKGLLISATGRILQQCVECLPTMPLQETESEASLKDQAGWIVFECLLAILRVMVNITHDSEFGSTRLGGEEGLLETILQCVVCTQWSVPPDQRFDLLVLSLGLLVNLMEHCLVNRRRLVETSLVAQIREGDEARDMTAVQAMVELFLQRERAATEMEEEPESPTKGGASPNKSGEWRESDSGIEWIAKSAEKVKAAEEQRLEAAREGGEGEREDGDKTVDGASILEDEETFTKALHKAGKHMENSIVASYVGLLLGCLIQDDKKYVEAVREHLPNGSFESMIKILKKFLGFMSLTTAIGTTDANSIQRVIDTLEAC